MHPPRDQLPSDRLDRLKELGFEWEPLQERQWNEKYDRLLAFKRVHGHCNVPYMYSEDPQLSGWVSGPALPATARQDAHPAQ